MNLIVPLTQKKLPAVKPSLSAGVVNKRTLTTNIPAKSATKSSPEKQASLPDRPEDIKGLSTQDKLKINEIEMLQTANDLSRLNKAFGTEIPTGTCVNHLVDNIAAHLIAIKLDVRNLEKDSSSGKNSPAGTGATNGNHSSAADKKTKATDKKEKTEQPAAMANKEKTKVEASKTPIEAKKPDPLMALFSLEHQKLNLENTKTEKSK